METEIRGFNLCDVLSYEDEVENGGGPTQDPGEDELFLSVTTLRFREKN